MSKKSPFVRAVCFPKSLTVPIYYTQTLGESVIQILTLETMET